MEIKKEIADKAVEFAVKLHMLEKEYGFVLVGGRIGQIQIMTSEGDIIKVLNQIEIKRGEDNERS